MVVSLVWFVRGIFIVGDENNLLYGISLYSCFGNDFYRFEEVAEYVMLVYIYLFLCSDVVLAFGCELYLVRLYISVVDGHTLVDTSNNRIISSEEFDFECLRARP